MSAPAPTSNDLIQLFLNKRRLAKALKSYGDPAIMDHITSNLASIEAEVREHFEEQVKAEKEQQARLEQARNEFNELLKKTGVSVEELTGVAAPAMTQKNKSSRIRKKVDPAQCRYVFTNERGEKEGWNGGAGRKPQWVSKIQNEGGSIEDYLNPNFEK
ncbi:MULTISPECIES: H-NS family nucleoid-associated regulatory protein [Aeromonas]|uniref:H-NS family histone-like protein n=1 Tax=Aeromonas TaxID=642 RepID=UPI002B052208|nr:H-NS family nucleoid-associated regulatory protein [Aeromonas jandaei]